MSRKKNKFLPALLYLIIAAPHFCLARPVTTYSLNSSTVKTIEDWADQDTIVLIELDDVLFTPVSSMFRYNSPYRNFMQELLVNSEKVPSYKELVGNWYRQRKVKLIEEGWPEFINRLQAKGVKVYGFCALPIDIKGIDKKISDETKSFGINFTEKVNQDKVVTIFEQEGWQSVFYNGIIFSGPLSKAQAIVDFMKVTNISPEKIAVFDNIKYILGQIDMSLRTFDIDFYTIEYLAARDLVDTVNPEIIKFQQRQLILKGLWLEDEQAKASFEFNREK